MMGLFRRRKREPVVVHVTGVLDQAAVAREIETILKKHSNRSGKWIVGEEGPDLITPEKGKPFIPTDELPEDESPEDESEDGS